MQPASSTAPPASPPKHTADGYVRLLDPFGSDVDGGGGSDTAHKKQSESTDKEDSLSVKCREYVESKLKCLGGGKLSGVVDGVANRFDAVTDGIEVLHEKGLVDGAKALLDGKKKTKKGEVDISELPLDELRALYRTRARARLARLEGLDEHEGIAGALTKGFRIPGSAREKLIARNPSWKDPYAAADRKLGPLLQRVNASSSGILSRAGRGIEHQLVGNRFLGQESTDRRNKVATDIIAGANTRLEGMMRSKKMSYPVALPPPPPEEGPPPTLYAGFIERMSALFPTAAKCLSEKTRGGSGGGSSGLAPQLVLAGHPVTQPEKSGKTEGDDDNLNVVERFGQGVEGIGSRMQGLGFKKLGGGLAGLGDGIEKAADKWL